jgi:hypothetical protein
MILFKRILSPTQIVWNAASWLIWQRNTLFSGGIPPNWQMEMQLGSKLK